MRRSCRFVLTRNDCPRYLYTHTYHLHIIPVTSGRNILQQSANRSRFSRIIMLVIVLYEFIIRGEGCMRAFQLYNDCQYSMVFDESKFLRFATGRIESGKELRAASSRMQQAAEHAVRRRLQQAVLFTIFFPYYYSSSPQSRKKRSFSKADYY